jgi:uncharacterized protein
MRAPFRPLTLSLLPGQYAILRSAPDAAVPTWASVGKFFSITRAHDELSVVCAAEDIPASDRPETLWHVFKVHGPFKFDEIGILASLAAPMAVAEVGIFVISTFDTDYLLVQSRDLRKAISTLQSAGHKCVDSDFHFTDSKESEA